MIHVETLSKRSVYSTSSLVELGAETLSDPSYVNNYLTYVNNYLIIDNAYRYSNGSVIR